MRRLRQSSFLGKEEKPEEFRWAEHRRLQGEIEVDQRGEGEEERVEPPWISG